MTEPVGRLTRRAEFLNTAAGRRRWAAPGLVLQVRRRPEAADGPGAERGARVGFTVSRKVGGAVERNRVRRRLRAAAREVLPEHACKATDYVIIGRREALGRRYSDLLGDLRTAMRKLGAFVERPEAGR